MNDQPLISDAYRARVEAMVARFAAACANGGGSYYDRQCLAGWLAELKRLREGRIY